MGGAIEGVLIVGGFEKAAALECDEIIIASLAGKDTIYRQLLDAGVPAGRINMSYVQTTIEARINFLRDYAFIYKDKIKSLPVAEGGVFQGDFAKIINETFSSSTLYLFDTFEGFDERDIIIEKKNNFSEDGAKHLGNTSEDLVLSKLPYRDKAVIRKGFFPETAWGIEDKIFFFVNLDFDLYAPTLEGLRFFYPKLADCGMLLIHDYFNENLQGVKQAVKDFEVEIGYELIKYPIGDHCSIAITKKGTRMYCNL